MKLTLLAICPALLFAACSQHDEADKIYTNADVWTGDSTQPRATVLAIKGDSILYVGDKEDLFKGKNTVVVNMQGKMIVPGFIDNHTHFLSGGYDLASVVLREARTKKDFIETLKTFCLAHPDGRWVQGGDWDHEAWGGDLPRKEWIDSISPGSPVFVSRYDGHMALANSKALRLAGIDRNTVAPHGGEIVKDEKGEPTGVLKDNAQELVYRVIPTPTDTQLDEYAQRAIQEALKNGVTEVHDVSSYDGKTELATYRRAYANNKLPMRIYAFVPIANWRYLDSFCKVNGKGDDRLHWGAVKGFVDGSLGSTTAWFYQPYLDAPNNTGLQVTDTILLHNWVISADSAGLQVACHAIGDRAIDFILKVYQEAEQRNPGKDHRFRIEHAQHLSAAAIPMFAQLQVIASMQPYHAIDDGRWAYKRLDDTRLRRTYMFNTLLKNGATVTFGSDWTVAPLKPLMGIYAAVTRQTLDGKNPGGWYPEEKLTVDQALRCYTVNNAYAGFQEKKLGRLKAGMLADFVVLSDNLFNIPPEKIKEVSVLRTFVDGKEVFTRK
jgi:predicted amidohydrolase YtcJ